MAKILSLFRKRDTAEVDVRRQASVARMRERLLEIRRDLSIVGDGDGCDLLIVEREGIEETLARMEWL